MLEITNVIDITVQEAPLGLGDYNVNNVGFFTTDAFLSNPDSDVWRAYVSAEEVGSDFGTGTETYDMAVAFFSQVPNVLNGGGQLIIFPRSSTETLAQAITRVADDVFYVGIISNFYPTGGDRETLADAVQALGNKILILPSATSADIAGVFTDIKDNGDTFTRCLFYSTTDADARLFAAAYAGAGFSTNFDLAAGTLTMNLKQLRTIDPDEGITQTIYNNARTAGVDVYVSYNGIPSVVSNGVNKYFDQVYNLLWFVLALQVAGFNALRQTATKIPQTEPGMLVLKSAYRTVCEQALNNGYVAPGTWNSPDTFGNQTDFISNILQRGYYIYSQPVSEQDAEDRADRKAPIIRIAIKEAGAIQSSDVVVNVNA